MITGYKGFNGALKCREFQYAIGGEYTHEGKVEVCASGFHFCENPMDIFNYYSPANNRFAAVIGSGESRKHKDDSKVACATIRIERELTLAELCSAAAEYILKGVSFEGAATNTGDRSVATNTGDRSAATNTGNWSVATNTGGSSVAANTGNCSAATNTGNWSAATNTGGRSAATNTGDWSVATNTGDWSVATNTGNWSVATNTGGSSVALVIGSNSSASVEKHNSVAIAAGIDCRAKGVIGSILFFVERDKEGKVLNHLSIVVDGEKIKEGIFYKLMGGKVVEDE